MKRALHYAAILLLLCRAAQAATQDPLAWVNALRREEGRKPLGTDQILSAAASAYAAELAAIGAISHTGPDGSGVLDRFRRAGGTEARVGEILGAGPDLASIESAWGKSTSHKPLILKPYWTHVGWGSAGSPGGKAQVWVVLFCEKQVIDLTIVREATGLSIRGQFVSNRAAESVVFSGISRESPVLWDPASGRFVYLLKGDPGGTYVRVGYVSAEGAFVLTNAFTSPRDTAIPGAPSRSSAPSPRP